MTYCATYALTAFPVRAQYHSAHKYPVNPRQTTLTDTIVSQTTAAANSCTKNNQKNESTNAMAEHLRLNEASN
jgi:hypothetical protein